MSIGEFSQVNAFLNTGQAQTGKINRGAIQHLADKVVAARVVDISLNENSKLWNKAGKWAGLGTIQFQLMDVPSNEVTNANNTFSNLASPLFPQQKNYPLVNEFVLLFRLPNQYQTQSSKKESYYYLNPINIWNHPQQNAYPDIYDYNNASPAQSKDYQQIEAGNVRKSSPIPNTLSLNGFSGGTFNDDLNVRPLLPFAGDNIIEGRFGNTIRLGNTSKLDQGIKNNWSEAGSNGNPITIIRNGQPESDEEGWIPSVEDINEDPASIYMTSNQEIPIKVSVITEKIEGEGATIPFSDMVKNTPKSPPSYNQPQVILNSGRLLFNTTTDSIIMSAKKSIILESVEDLGIKSREKNVNIFSEKGYVSLGRKNSKESIVLGDTMVAKFVEALESIKGFCDGVKTTTPELYDSAANCSDTLQSIIDFSNEGTLLSKYVKSS